MKKFVITEVEMKEVKTATIADRNRDWVRINTIKFPFVVEVEAINDEEILACRIADRFNEVNHLGAVIAWCVDFVAAR